MKEKDPMFDEYGESWVGEPMEEHDTTDPRYYPNPYKGKIWYDNQKLLGALITDYFDQCDSIVELNRAMREVISDIEYYADMRREDLF